MICNFSPVAFYIFSFPIHWYSLAYIFGILIALKLTEFLEKKRTKFYRTELKIHFQDFINYAIIGIIIGGRTGHILFYDFNYYINNCTEILKIWKGGMSFFGGFIGVICATYLFCRKNDIDFLEFIDLWSVSIPIGLCLGRIANFINGELLGKKSDVAWNVVFHDSIPRHPSQLYEAIAEGVLLFLIMMFAFHKKSYLLKGRLSGIFCVGYGLARFCCEFFREADSFFSYQLFSYSGLNLNQYLSISVILLGIILISRSSKQHV